MGTYLLGTIYDVIAPFLLEMGKNSGVIVFILAECRKQQLSSGTSRQFFGTISRHSMNNNYSENLA